MSNVRHVLGISGGKDSAALAIYLRNMSPAFDITCSTILPEYQVGLHELHYQ